MFVLLSVVRLSVFLFVCMLFRMSVRLYVLLKVCMFFCLSVRLYALPSVCPSAVLLSVCMFFCLSVRLFVFLSVCLSVCMSSVHLFVRKLEGKYFIIYLYLHLLYIYYSLYYLSIFLILDIRDNPSGNWNWSNHWQEEVRRRWFWIRQLYGKISVLLMCERILFCQPFEPLSMRWHCKLVQIH